MGAMKHLVVKTNKGKKAHQQPGTTETRLQSMAPMPLIMTRVLCLIALLFVGLLISVLSYTISDLVPFSTKQPLYLYWGYHIDCPGKHCDTCAGLGHQESSLRCALEEALFLHRTFVMPSRMCINQQHNDKGILRASTNSGNFEGWGVQSCAMDSLYDLALISQTVKVILDSSAEWHQALSKARLLKTAVDIKDISRSELKHDSLYKEAVVINRTASPLAWFVECSDRKNHRNVLLPYSFLPKMAAKPLRLVAETIIEQLGDYDAIHVRRGDKLKIRKDRFGVNRTLFPHLDRDTQAGAILRRIGNWIPEGRTLFVASNERKPGFFDALGTKYKVVFISHFKSIVDPVVQNNYQLFIIERLILFGAKTYVKTFKEDPSDLSLTNDIKKKLRAWEIPVYTFDNSSGPLGCWRTAWGWICLGAEEMPSGGMQGQCTAIVGGMKRREMGRDAKGREERCQGKRAHLTNKFNKSEAGRRGYQAPAGE
ncbi:hypothetical protein GOP47_0017867 [Adiantum capillus-veneris]|uniref:O-fucosyltransferase family protein n=1 Tax=Adiantum capillus-veneris TaxID=13818 RepID=A0A9D4UG80_ADICA|nr:hypothetical protein GOP47_0017867 [Adiantum capillus-veneris]